MLTNDLTIYSDQNPYTDLSPEDIPERSVIRRLWDTGHFNNPQFPGGRDVTESDLPKLHLSDTCVKQAIQSYQAFDANGNVLSLAIHHRDIIPDGEPGPATRRLFTLDRCGEPDYAPPEVQAEMAAIGPGSWANCHGFTGHHAAIVGMDMRYRPGHLAGDILIEVLKWIQTAYDGVGLRWIFRDNATMKDVLTGERVEGQLNTRWSWVTRSNGWIGLATVPSRALPCQHSEIFCQFLATYVGGNSPTAIINQCGSLGKHELGHNTGRSHTSGGVMNPSIINGLPMLWTGDPSYDWLVGRFGGPIRVADPVPRTWVAACLKDNKGGEFCVPLSPPIPVEDPRAGRLFAGLD